MSLGDNVFSVAMTLLAFSIHVPGDADTTSFGLRNLLAAAPDILSYVFGFLVLGQYWIAHHNTFHQLRRSDRLFIWLNLAFLMGVAFVPVAAAALGRYPGAPAAVAFFGVTLLYTSSVLLGLWCYACRHRRLVDSCIDPRLIRAAFLRIGLPIPLQCASIALAYLPLSAILPSGVDRHWRRDLA